MKLARSTLASSAGVETTPPPWPGGRGRRSPWRRLDSTLHV